MTPRPPRVSVIIPTHNRRDLLRAAVDSALAQTYPDVEVIVVDDGSTDDTTTAMAQYAGRVVYLRQTNQGVAAARNTGIWAATGEYLTFLDDDDLIHPDKLALHIPFLEAERDFGLSYSAWQQISEDGTRILGEVRPNRQGQLGGGPRAHLAGAEARPGDPSESGVPSPHRPVYVHASGHRGRGRWKQLDVQAFPVNDGPQVRIHS
jgi:glycosyltransferase involved in cell wall biosynthesis